MILRKKKILCARFFGLALALQLNLESLDNKVVL